MKLGKITAMVLSIAVLLVSCSGGDLPKVEYKDGRLVSRDGTVYIAAPAGYEPVSVGDPCAYFEEADTTLYKIGTLDSSQWMTEEYAGEATAVFYNENITLPSLEEMDASTVYVCQATASGSVSLMTIDDDEFIKTAVNAAVSDGEEHIWPPPGTELNLDLKFYSENYPAFYYNVSVACGADGYYVYNRGSGNGCIFVGDIFEQYLGSLY